MAKIRVYELAKKLNMTNKVLLSKLKAMNIDVKSHMSSLENDIAVQIKNNLLGRKKTQSEVRVKSSVIRRRKPKEVLPEDTDEPNQGAILPVDSEEQLLSKSDLKKDLTILKEDSEKKQGGEKESPLSDEISKKDDNEDHISEKNGKPEDKKINDPSIAQEPVKSDKKPAKKVAKKPAKTDNKSVKPAKKIVKSGESAKIIRPVNDSKTVSSVEPSEIKAASEGKAMAKKESQVHVSSAETEKTEESIQTEIQEEKQGAVEQKDALKETAENILKTGPEKKSEKDMKKQSGHAEVEPKTEIPTEKKPHGKKEIQETAETPLDSGTKIKPEASNGSEVSTDSGISMKTDGVVGPHKVSTDKDSSDSDIKKKRRRKKKAVKKSTPAKIIRMAVPLPVKPVEKKNEHGEGKHGTKATRFSKRKIVIDKPAKSSAKPAYKKVSQGKIFKKPGAVPLSELPSEPKLARKKDKKKKDHVFANSEDLAGKKKKFKKRKSIVEGKDLYERKPKGKRGRRKDSRAKKNKIQSTLITTPKAIKRRVKIDETIELSEFAKRMGIKANEMIQKLMTLGVMVTLNQTIDFDTATLVASEFGFEVERASFEEDILIHAHDTENEAGEQTSRSPVVTIMGHVDHGKTSLLDVIRKSKITTGEAGGITQHIGAYNVKTDNGTITFLDTPGHAAFTSMRARGAQITDIVVLVVAADDGVMPQTIEAINHSKNAGVPVVVAINKMDKPDADPDRVTRELSDHGLVSEEWGGDVIFVKVSAKAEMGINTLLEMILLQSEVLELKANPDRLANGHVVEARLDAGRGPIATIIVEQGTLKIGQPVVCGLHAGKVRMMIDDTGAMIDEAGPSTPVEIIGLSGVPESGDEFVALDSEKDAKQISLHRMQKQRSKELAKKSRANLAKLFASMTTDKTEELNLIIKADVNGSIEALNDSLVKLSKEEVNIKIVHSGTGTINESDVSLAVVSHSIIIGFNVRPGSNVREMAKKENVDMRFYDIIYDVINDIKAAINGLMPSTFQEIIIGRAEVRDTFVIPNKGTIAGSFVSEGKVIRGEKIRLLRDGVVKCDSTLLSLRRFKDDVKEVAQGYECGISLEKYNDIKIGDVFECYKTEEIRPGMESAKE